MPWQQAAGRPIERWIGERGKSRQDMGRRSIDRCRFRRTGRVTGGASAQCEYRTLRAAQTVFPKGTDLSVNSQAQLNKVARQLHERLRKTLSFETPAEKFNACVESTG